MLQNISKILLTEEQIQTRVKELAAELSAEYVGKDPIFVGVLKGVVIFWDRSCFTFILPVDSVPA